MTREEYERLLQSDYWKGYSYSLIKERNFTCEDCGRRFPNERNKLQVHHLVYRDANPWSYRPEELVVLCEDCHRKRHGFVPDSEFVQNNSQTTTRDNFTSRNTHTTREWDLDSLNDNHKFNYKNVLYIFLCLIVIAFGINYSFKDKTHQEEIINKDVVSSPTIDDSKDIHINDISKEYGGHKEASKKILNTTSSSLAEYENQEEIISDTKEEINNEEFSTSEVAERKASTDAEEKLNNNGVSAESSTSDIYERISHANAIKAGKRAGVSTEGSTSDIYERISHANAIKAGKRAGVSTEGSTSDIYERISHANAVKAGKRAGVSTEGSTSDIYERISHANAIEAAKRAGVSTEGSTSEIYERLMK